MFFNRCILPEDFIRLREDVQKYIIDSRYFIIKKNDRNTTAGILKGKEVGLRCDLWIKRFNYTNYLKYIAKLFFGSRAIRLYKKNLDLYKRGLPVPEPIGYIELSLKEKNSYFISSVLKDVKTLSEFYRVDKFARNREIVKSIASALADWHLKGTVHGDLKWQNILVNSDQNGYKVYFVDLDQVRIYSKPDIKGIMKDIVRFYRFSFEIGVDEWVKKEFFDSYIEIVYSKVKGHLNYDDITNRAYREWIEKGSKKYYVL